MGEIEGQGDTAAPEPWFAVLSLYQFDLIRLSAKILRQQIAQRTSAGTVTVSGLRGLDILMALTLGCFQPFGAAKVLTKGDVPDV